MREIVASGGDECLNNRQKGETCLNNRQEAYVEAIEAAEYEKAAPLSTVAGSPAVQAELKTRRVVRINGPLAHKALKAIEKLVESDSTPAATRFSAAKWVMEQAGHTGQVGDGKDKPTGEMTTAELEALIRKLEDGLREAGSGPMVNITPGNGA